MALAANNTNLFICLADKPAPKWTNIVGLPQRNPCYGYNMAGTGRYPATGASLGLDRLRSRQIRWWHLPAESQVKVPSDMIALADCKPISGGEDNDLDDLFPINLLSELAPRHNQGENSVFCDGHVEYAKHTAWLKKSDRARQRWNNDHQSHPETWANNP